MGFNSGFKGLITTANFHQTAKHPVPKALSTCAVILKMF